MSNTIISLEHSGGIARLCFTFPNARFGWQDLAALVRAVEPLHRSASLGVLVVRSAHPDGFGRGPDLRTLEQPEDRLRFAKEGQELLARWLALPMPTLAHLHGHCFGPAWEFALACDYRIATTGPQAWIGWPHMPSAWGGRHWTKQLASRSVRHQLDQGERLTAKEALRAGLIDDAFTARRALVEERHWLHRLRESGDKRTATPCRVAWADDRRRFSQWQPAHPECPVITTTIAGPQTLGIVGAGPHAAEILVETALAGGIVTSTTQSLIQQSEATWASAEQRGRVTPLELQQARQRVKRMTDPVQLLYFSDDRLSLFEDGLANIGSRTILVAPPASLPMLAHYDSRRDRQIGLSLNTTTKSAELVPWTETSERTRHITAAWLNCIGYQVNEETAVPASVAEEQMALATPF